MTINNEQLVKTDKMKTLPFILVVFPFRFSNFSISPSNIQPNMVLWYKKNT